MIDIEQISYSIKGTNILKNITFKIPKSSIFGLLGSNGAGKSTLIKIILGLADPDSGHIAFDNCVVNEFNRIKLLKRTGSLIEHTSAYDFLSPLENLELARRIYGTEKGHSEELLKIVGLEESIKKKVKTFSLGMKQRLGIALAMIGKPDFVVLDEPTNGLDPTGINELSSLIVALNKRCGTTFLISSHNLTEIEKIATHYTIIDKGVTVHTAKLVEGLHDSLSKTYFDIVKE